MNEQLMTVMRVLRAARSVVGSVEALETVDRIVNTLATELAYYDGEFNEDVFYNYIIRGTNVDGTPWED